MNSTELREEIAWKTATEVLQAALPNYFWSGHEVAAAAKALLPLLSAARDEGAQQMREACRKIAMDLAKKCDRDARGDHKAAVLWDAYHAMGQARHPTPPSL